MVWRAVGDVAEPYPEWLRALRDASGVYAIRERRLLLGPVVVYVGESHTGRLKKTITRHLQSWARSKSFWADMFGLSDADPGFTYFRRDVEVAVQVTPAKLAVATQAEWIDRLKPRDNINLTDEGTDVPF